MRRFYSLVIAVPFVMFTLIAPQMSRDDIVYNYYICAVLLGFLAVWIVAWSEKSALRVLRPAPLLALPLGPIVEQEPEPAPTEQTNETLASGDEGS